MRGCVFIYCVSSEPKASRVCEFGLNTHAELSKNFKNEMEGLLLY
jgi:hypothetical protein